MDVGQTVPSAEASAPQPSDHKRVQPIVAGNRMTQPSNQEIADVLNRIADLLEVQNANVFRVRAYRLGADTVRTADRTIADIVHRGRLDELEALPNIGDKQARLIADYVHTGRSALLDRLQGELEPADLFSSVPGVGEKLAGRITAELGIHTLEELEMAAHDGRLDAVEGFGPKRIEAVQSSLVGMLSQSAQRRSRQRVQGRGGTNNTPPAVSLLLALDEEYRRKARKDELRKIAPKRFNRDGDAWLPIMHTEREGWDFTLLFSNTARAHELNKTHDWVVIYYERDSVEHQATVVTESGGVLDGLRVVRGREAECKDYYKDASSN